MRDNFDFVMDEIELAFFNAKFIFVMCVTKTELQLIMIGDEKIKQSIRIIFFRIDQWILMTQHILTILSPFRRIWLNIQAIMSIIARFNFYASLKSFYEYEEKMG